MKTGESTHRVGDTGTEIAACLQRTVRPNGMSHTIRSVFSVTHLSCVDIPHQYGRKRDVTAFR